MISRQVAIAHSDVWGNMPCCQTVKEVLRQYRWSKIYEVISSLARTCDND